MSRPNILWVVIDALRYDRVGCNGCERPISPTIDALADRGRRFTTAISQSGWSLPSYATMLTGLYPCEHGMQKMSNTLSSEIPTLPEHLQKAGYTTICVTGNPYVQKHFNLARGFDKYIHHAPYLTNTRQHEHFSDWAMPDLQRRLRKWGGAVGLCDKGGAMIANDVERLVQEAQEPWFLYVNLMEVHDPYFPPWGYVPGFASGMSARASALLRHVLNFGGHGRITNPRYFGGNVNAEDWEQTRRLYEAEVAYSDELVGRMLSGVEDAKRGENTITIINSDHGEFLGEGKLVSHTVGLGEALIHVPLILAGPFADGGQVFESPVEVRDIPTGLCDVAEAPMLEQSPAREAVKLLDSSPA